MLLLLKFYDDLKLIFPSRKSSEIYWVFIAKVSKREAVILQEELVAEHREMQIIFIIMVCITGYIIHSLLLHLRKKKSFLFQDLLEIGTTYNNLLEEPDDNLKAISDLIHLLNIFFKKSLVRKFFVFH